jgi:hypothetical protein
MTGTLYRRYFAYEWGNGPCREVERWRDYTPMSHGGKRRT